MRREIYQVIIILSSVVFVAYATAEVDPQLASFSTRYQRTYLDTREDTSRRGYNTRVWINRYKVPELDKRGEPTGNMVTKEEEFIEKASGLFYRNPHTGALEETFTNWSTDSQRQGGLVSNQRADKVEAFIDQSRGQFCLDYTPQPNQTFRVETRSLGFYNAATGKFQPLLEMDRPAIRSGAGTDTLSGKLGPFDFQSTVTKTGVHLNLFVNEPIPLPDSFQEADAKELYLVMRYEILSPSSRIFAFRGSSVVPTGECLEFTGERLPIGTNDKRPDFYLSASRVFYRDEPYRFTYSWKRVCVEEGKLTVLEGIPYSSAQSDQSRYPLIIDPFFERSPDEGSWAPLMGETFESGKTYFISYDYGISDGSHLIIEPGAIVKINGPDTTPDPDHYIRILAQKNVGSDPGIITVAGEPYRYVIVTSADDTSVGADVSVTGSNYRPGIHGGIAVGQGTQLSKFAYMKITNGLIGILLYDFVPDISTTASQATIRDCVFGDLKYWAVGITLASLGVSSQAFTLTNNLFKACEEGHSDITSGDRVSDIEIANYDKSLNLELRNNTFATENINLTKTNVKIIYYADFSASCAITSYSNVFVRNNSNQYYYRFIKADPGYDVTGSVALTGKCNVYLKDGVTSDPHYHEGITVTYDPDNPDSNTFLNANPFEAISNLGSYYISDTYRSTFEDKGFDNVGDVALWDKTIIAPIDDPASVDPQTGTEVHWAKQYRDGEDLSVSAAEKVDVGYHYDPVDYLLKGGIGGGYSVPENMKLIIHPGVVVAGREDRAVVVEGQSLTNSGGVEAIGLPGEPIRWEPVTTCGDRMTVGSAGFWKGLMLSHIDSDSPANVEFNVFEYTFWGLNVDRTRDGIADIESNVMNYTLLGVWIGYYGVGGNVIFANNRILNSGSNYGLSLFECRADVYNNTLVTDSASGIIVCSYGIGDSQAIPRISQNVIIGSNVGIYIECDEDATNPILSNNLVWDWRVQSHSYLSDMTNDPVPMTGNPRYVSSRAVGFNDDSEHYFLAQVDGDASRIPWRCKDITSIEVEGISNGDNGTGEIEIHSYDEGLNDTELGSYSLSGSGGYTDGSAATNEGDVFVLFRGPLVIESFARVVITRSGGSQMEIAIPRSWRTPAGQDPRAETGSQEAFSFWIAIDGSLYFTTKVFPRLMRDSLFVHPEPELTAHYAMRYLKASGFPLDLNNGVYDGALAISAYDANLPSAAKLVPVRGPAPFYDYPGTASRFKKGSSGNILTTFPDTGFVDLGYHGFRGRSWFRDEDSTSGLRLSWDRPDEFKNELEKYEARLTLNGQTPDPYGWNEIQEDDIIVPYESPWSESFPLAETDLANPHKIEIRAVPKSGQVDSGDISTIEFGVDRQTPTLSIEDVVATEKDKQDFIYFDRVDTVLYNDTIFPTGPSSLDLVVSMLDTGPSGKNPSGPWKYVVKTGENNADTLSAYDEEYPYDPVNPTQVTVSSVVSGNLDVRVEAYDQAGKMDYEDFAFSAVCERRPKIAAGGGAVEKRGAS